MSRPKIPDPRDLRITVRVTVKEFIRARHAADKRGQTLADFARERILKPARKRRQPAVIVEHDAIDPDTRHQIRKIGVNINQIAHRLNATGEIVPSQLIEALALLRRIINRSIEVPPRGPQNGNRGPGA